MPVIPDLPCGKTGHYRLGIKQAGFYIQEGGLKDPERWTSLPESAGNFCPALGVRINGLKGPEHWP